jgi:DNA invertase Pin-like site-specific DNA recombinase
MSEYQKRYYQQNKERIAAHRKAIKQSRYAEKRLLNPDLPETPRKGTSKLNEAKVREIRRRLAEGESVAEIAHAFGVSTYNIYAIRQGRTWPDVRPNETGAN